MNKKYFFITLGVFVMAISSLYVVTALTTIDLGETVAISTPAQCVQDYTVDLDYTDGRVLYLYSAWKVKDPYGVTVIDNPLESLSNGSYSFTAIFELTGEEMGTYKFYPAIFYVEQVYNNDTEIWETIDSGQCVYDTERDLVIVGCPTPSVEDVLAVIQMLYEQWENNL